MVGGGAGAGGGRRRAGVEPPGAGVAVAVGVGVASELRSSSSCSCSSQSARVVALDRRRQGVAEVGVLLLVGVLDRAPRPLERPLRCGRSRRCARRARSRGRCGARSSPCGRARRARPAPAPPAWGSASASAWPTGSGRATGSASERVLGRGRGHEDRQREDRRSPCQAGAHRPFILEARRRRARASAPSHQWCSSIPVSSTARRPAEQLHLAALGRVAHRLEARRQLARDAAPAPPRTRPGRRRRRSSASPGSGTRRSASRAPPSHACSASRPRSVSANVRRRRPAALDPLLEVARRRQRAGSA